MTRQDLEDDLFQLAAQFPIPSVAPAVMARVENVRLEPIPRPSRKGHRTKSNHTRCSSQECPPKLTLNVSESFLRD